MRQRHKITTNVRHGGETFLSDGSGYLYASIEDIPDKPARIVNGKEIRSTNVGEKVAKKAFEKPKKAAISNPKPQPVADKGINAGS